MAACRRMFCTVAHGWNVDYSAQEEIGREYCFGVESDLGLTVSGTLLGPEGTAVWSVSSVLPVSCEAV
ncbi:hypothetical protein, partial [Streptomyces sp. BE303]|uniref:hypothetical protein n=1 Tax=Streptomyces sp. BE303 TaxID=3002528 RepID=UPI002E7A49E9